jgi:hypothetical protein
MVGLSKVSEKSSTVRRSLSYRVKPNCSNVNKKRSNFYLILGIRLMYKFVISYIKRNFFFLVFLKYWSSSHGFNKLVIKAQNAC